MGKRANSDSNATKAASQAKKLERNAKKQADKAQELRAIAEKASKQKSFPAINIPFIKNSSAYIDFLKNLDMHTAILGHILIVLGMALIASISSRAKNISKGMSHKLSSVNFYIKKLIVHSPYSKYAIGTIVAFNTLEYFRSADEITLYLSSLENPVNGKLIPYIQDHRDLIDTHRGGLYKSYIGSLTTDPVYNPNKYGIHLAQVSTLEEVIGSLPLDVKLSTPEISKFVIQALTMKEDISFTDGQNFQTIGNLVPLESDIVKLAKQAEIPFNIDRVSPSILEEESLDPDEEGISDLERILRQARRNK